MQVQICLQDLPERLTLKIEQNIVHLNSGLKSKELQWHMPTLSYKINKIYEKTSSHIVGLIGLVLVLSSTWRRKIASTAHTVLKPP
eukprot:764585-Pelagomonas_calceolata.AAC.1